MRRSNLALAALALPIAACSSTGVGEIDRGVYQLVRVRPTSVGNGAMVVTPPRPWNEQRRLFFFTNVSQVEDWTLNGPYLDGMTFISGLPNKKAIVRQWGDEDRQVPQFRSDMTAPEIVAMLETAYRIRGGALEFKTIGLVPRPFLGHPGFQFDFEHLDTDEVWRKGRAVGAVIDGRLYLILLDAARSHYFANAVPDFEAIVASARLRGRR